MLKAMSNVNQLINDNRNKSCIFSSFDDNATPLKLVFLIFTVSLNFVCKCLELLIN